MRLVLGADRLGSARKAAQESKAPGRFVENWCRRVKATGRVDGMPWVGRPRASLASRGAYLHMKERVKRDDNCPLLANWQ